MEFRGDKAVGKQDAGGAAYSWNKKQLLLAQPCASLTSQVHLVSRSPVGFLFAFVAGDGGIFEGAPVGFVAFQRQLLGPAGHVGGHLTWSELLKQADPQETSVFPQNFSPGKLLSAAWVVPTPAWGLSHSCTAGSRSGAPIPSLDSSVPGR